MGVVRFLGVLVFAAVAAIEVFGQEQRDQPLVAQTERGDLAKSIQIFPNPALGDYVHVRFENFKAQDIRFSLHNIIGNELPAEVEIVDEHEIRVRVKELSTGYYLLGLKDKTSRFQSTLKFVKK